jgi:hypothetical protein
VPASRRAPLPSHCGCTRPGRDPALLLQPHSAAETSLCRGFARANPCALTPLPCPQAIERDFEALDEDGGGAITLEELINGARRVGGKGEQLAFFSRLDNHFRQVDMPRARVRLAPARVCLTPAWVCPGRWT